MAGEAGQDEAARGEAPAPAPAVGSSRPPRNRSATGTRSASRTRGAPRGESPAPRAPQPLTKEVLLGCTTSNLKTRNETPEHFLQRLTHLQLQGQRLGPDLARLDLVTGATVVFAYDNLISSLSGFEHLRKLQLLYLQNNRLATMAGIEVLTNLKTLHVGHNRLERIEGLENMRQLEELHCAGQKPASGIPTALDFCPESIATITHTLQVLDASSNNIADITPLLPLQQLRSLDLSSNLLAQVHDLRPMLSSEVLTRVFLNGNPLAANDRKHRTTVVLFAPVIEEIDGKAVLPAERDFVRRLEEQKRKLEKQKQVHMLRRGETGSPAMPPSSKEDPGFNGFSA